ncbi:hypothetical protein Z042_13780 [Chania multitudinisentens RB-25]|uniref:Invasin domain-containing protein n=1 Tax=Chania multitudinisentens RB-25 TaxID=1441930 RepID=W0LF53_9GAMM|nr:BACON domain-containing protein [Chania multitudinisentens]AHG20575.1 hypothetical protein Z042_13780 [Chania multitudinisentens RB-25]
MVDGSLIPDQFTLSSSTAGLVPQDADDDTGLSVQVNQADGAMVWLFNGTPLTQVERGVPLGDHFAGQTLELEVNAPVTVSSTTGLPTTAGPVSHTTRYTLRVPLVIPMPTAVRLNVNGTTFGMNEGFPTTGFNAAFFEFLMDGTSTVTNGDYTWTVDQAWVTVSNAGRVSFNAPPNTANRTVTVTATDPVSGGILAYTFTLNNWFINNGFTMMNWSDASSWCATQGLNQPSRAELTLGAGTRGIGSLWSEWGTSGAYNGSGFNFGGSHWTSEFSGSGSRFNVGLIDGRVSSVIDSSNHYVACVRSL